MAVEIAGMCLSTRTLLRGGGAVCAAAVAAYGVLTAPSHDEVVADYAITAKIKPVFDSCVRTIDDRDMTFGFGVHTLEGCACISHLARISVPTNHYSVAIEAFPALIDADWGDGDYDAAMAPLVSKYSLTPDQRENIVTAYDPDNICGDRDTHTEDAVASMIAHPSFRRVFQESTTPPVEIEYRSAEEVVAGLRQ